MADDEAGAGLQLRRALDLERDHLRGVLSDDAIVVVGYEDFLCPYCRKLRQVFVRLRESLGDRLVYVVRHFPNERAHPGAELAARAAEAAARQGRFYEMHDRLFDHEPPINAADILAMARGLDLDVERFERDLEGAEVRARVDEDLADARANGVTATPTLFVDGIRYDGAWDYQSMLEALDRPVAARLQRSARVFASLPTSAGLVLLFTAALALVCANTPLSSIYDRVMSTEIGIGPLGRMLSLTVRDWLSEGLLAVFFLVVGLEIRRDLTSGALADRRAATLPIVAAVGGVITPALIYLAIDRGPSSYGWPIPTATDVAFTLGLMAVLGDRIPTSLRVFVATLAVVDDVLSVLVLAVFFPHSFAPMYGLVVLGGVLVLVGFNRARVYVIWPYIAVTLVLWFALHALGVHAALAGVILAMCLPTRPTPRAVPLLAQAATALAALEQAERQGKQEDAPVREWAARNLAAASARLTSPAERIERAVAPWSAFLVLPLFAFSATGVSVMIDFSAPDAAPIFTGIVAGLVIGKPLGILLWSRAAIAMRIAAAPAGVALRQFIGAACLCGIGDTMSLLMADRAFAPTSAAIAKLAVLTGTVIAGIVGTLVLRWSYPVSVARSAAAVR